jgi:hypothetical protein
MALTDEQLPDQLVKGVSQLTDEKVCETESV